MTVESTFERERDRYLQFFRKSVSELQLLARELATEILVSVNNEQIPYPYRYLRVDALAKGEGGRIVPYEFAIDPDSAFVATTFSFRGVDLNLYPFTWNKVQVVFDRQQTGSLSLGEWIIAWLDVDERGANSGDGLAGAIHSASQVESSDHWSFLTVDLGTAPTSALMHLIDIIANTGAKRISIKPG